MRTLATAVTTMAAANTGRPASAKRSTSRLTETERVDAWGSAGSGLGAAFTAGSVPSDPGWVGGRAFRRSAMPRSMSGSVVVTVGSRSGSILAGTAARSGAADQPGVVGAGPGVVGTGPGVVGTRVVAVVVTVVGGGGGGGDGRIAHRRRGTVVARVMVVGGIVEPDPSRCRCRCPRLERSPPLSSIVMAVATTGFDAVPNVLDEPLLLRPPPGPVASPPAEAATGTTVGRANTVEVDVTIAEVVDAAPASSTLEYCHAEDGWADPPAGNMVERTVHAASTVAVSDTVHRRTPQSHSAPAGRGPDGPLLVAQRAANRDHRLVGGALTDHDRQVDTGRASSLVRRVRTIGSTPTHSSQCVTDHDRAQLTLRTKSPRISAAGTAILPR